MSSSPSIRGVPEGVPEGAQDVLGRLVRAASEGVLTGWQALPEGLSTRQLLAIDPPFTREPGLTSLLGQPAQGFRTAATEHAPTGVVVWTQHDEITLLEVWGPTSVDDPVAVLGEPTAIVPSGLGDSLDQLLWPSRGLVLHVARATGRLHRLYAFPAADLDQLLGSPLVAVAIHRRAR